MQNVVWPMITVRIDRGMPAKRKARQRHAGDDARKDDRQDHDEVRGLHDAEVARERQRQAGAEQERERRREERDADAQPGRLARRRVVGEDLEPARREAG
ncbi:MAG: hypothetical protein ACRDLS_00145 [Solirubrobacteraceae bacterium]